MDNILEVTSVSQSYRSGFWLRPMEVLHGIHLKVRRKSIFGFLGANGAGKTTLIHLITGLKRPTHGTIKILGLDASSPQARARIGYLPERPYFHEHLTGEGVLEYFGALSGMKRRDITKKSSQVLSSVNLLEARKIELRKYSKGMLQRIGIAQALLHDPEFLVLDEPMSGLDPIGRREMRELIQNLAAGGRTVFFSSHVIPDIEALCDEVAVIKQGRLVGSGKVTTLLGTYSEWVEIIFTGDFSDLSQFENIVKVPSGCKCTVRGQNRVDEVLPKLIAKKAQILSVQPIRPSLEDLFKN
jgi:ABC-2 type transport system ATP-binding protein